MNPLPYPLLWGFFAIILQKNGIHLKQILPPIGKVASTHWKGCFHPLEARFPDFGSKACRLWTIHSLRMTRQRLSTTIEHVQEALWYVTEPISQPKTTVNTRQNHVCKAYNIKLCNFFVVFRYKLITFVAKFK